jgi:hypothetical protein
VLEEDTAVPSCGNGKRHHARFPVRDSLGDIHSALEPLDITTIQLQSARHSASSILQVYGGATLGHVDSSSLHEQTEKSLPRLMSFVSGLGILAR